MDPPSRVMGLSAVVTVVAVTLCNVVYLLNLFLYNKCAGVDEQSKALGRGRYAEDL